MKKMRKILGVLMMCLMMLASGVYSGKVFASDNVTWNPNDKTSGVTLSADNLSATSSTWQVVRATKSVTSGKYYYEISNNGSIYHTGIGDIQAFVSTNPATTFGGTIHAIEFCADDGSLFYNASPVVVGSASFRNNGTVVGVALDADNKKISFYLNNVLQIAYDYSKCGFANNPVFPIIGTGGSPDSMNICTNFGATPFKYPVPNGYVPFNSNYVSIASISLDKSALNLKVGENSTVTASVYPLNATNQNITWSIDDGSIASIIPSGSTCNVTGLKVGTTTLRATTQDGNYVATCIVTVTNPSRAILTIHLVDGTEKEYDLSSAELNAFTTWYDNRASGTGLMRYGFTKNASKAAFKNRMEYIIFDKIVSFDVDQYDAQ